MDARGRVIGINAQIRSSSGNAEGVGFAVPINSARRSLEQLVENGQVAYAFVGITADDLTPSLARRLGDGVRRGALISESPGGPAAPPACGAATERSRRTAARSGPAATSTSQIDGRPFGAATT